MTATDDPTGKLVALDASRRCKDKREKVPCEAIPWPFLPRQCRLRNQFCFITAEKPVFLQFGAQICCGVGPLISTGRVVER